MKLIRKKKSLCNPAILSRLVRASPRGKQCLSAHSWARSRVSLVLFSIGQWAAVPLKRCLTLGPAVVCCRPEHGVLISIIVLLLKPGSVASQGQMVLTQV